MILDRAASIAHRHGYTLDDIRATHRRDRVLTRARWAVYRGLYGERVSLRKIASLLNCDHKAVYAAVRASRS